MKKGTVRAILCYVLVLTLLSSLLSLVPVSAADTTTLEKTELTVEKGTSRQIVVVNPKSGATYTYKASNKKVKVMADGVVKGVKVGKAKVVVREVYNKKTKKIGTVKFTVVKAEAVEDTVVYKNYFEDGDLNGLGARGSAALEISNSKNHTEGGMNSVYVTKRTSSWNGATLSLTKLVEVGKPYSFSAWVMQDSGTTQKISMKFDYKDMGGVSCYDSLDEGVECPSGKWVELKATSKIPENQAGISVYFEVPSSETASFYVDDLVIKGKKSEYKGFQKSEENYEVMKKAGVYSTGNNARIKKVIEKARAGETVSLAYIGGSVTEGALANPNSNCYVSVSAKKFAETYGKDGGANVHCINAGMSGTPSDIGVVRYQRDVLARLPEGSTHPDILFIEFAVNDYQCETGGGAYEGLIREALDSGSAVVLIFSVFQNQNIVCEMDYRRYGDYYDLPMVSMGNAIEKYVKEADFNGWYFGDTLHPNHQGYMLMADCIMELMDQIDQEAAETDNIKDVNSMKPLKTSAYQGIKLIDAATKEGGAVTSIQAGGFTGKDTATGNFQYEYNGKSRAAWFPDNWMHTADSGDDALEIKVKCKTIMLVYKLSGESAFGSADLYIDGKKKTTLSCYDRSGWNNGKVYLALTEEEAAEHTIELRMASGNEGKKFTLMAIGYK